MSAEPKRLLLAFLDQQQAQYEYRDHERAALATEVTGVLGLSLHQGAKALLLEVSGAPFPYVIAVAPGDLQVHTKRLRKNQGWRDAKLADRDTVRRLTGCEIGEVPPFGELFDIPTFVDESLFDNEIIGFSAADLHSSILMSVAEFRRISSVTVDRFSRSREAAEQEALCRRR